MSDLIKNNPNFDHYFYDKESIYLDQQDTDGINFLIFFNNTLNFIYK